MAVQPETTLTVTIPATEAELGRLAAIFGIDAQADDFRERLEPWLTGIAHAALEEYVLAFSGTRSPSTMRELRELRLRLLYRNLAGDAPSDAQVAQLFQLTRTQARNLIAGTRARHRVELEQTMSERAKNALRNSSNVDDSTARIVMSDSLVAYVNDLLSDTEAAPIERNKDAAQTYDVKRTTARTLARRLSLPGGEVGGFNHLDA